MTEWQRLTPGTEDRIDTNIYREHHDGIEIAWGFQDEGDVRRDIRSSPVLLSPAELDALIRISGRWREVEEVRALVATLEEVEWIETDTPLRGGGGNMECRCAWCNRLGQQEPWWTHEPDCHRQAAFAPFEAADG